MGAGSGTSSDVQLLFGVLGGGSISGESGREIYSQITSIISEINNDPLKIKVKIDEDSLSTMRNDIRQITDSFKDVNFSGSFAPMNLDINLGGSMINQQAKYGAMARSSIKDLQAQATELEEIFRSVNHAADGTTAAMQALGEANLLNSNTLDSLSAMYESKSSLTEKMYAYQEYINLMIKAAQTNGVDISSVTAKYTRSADEIAASTSKVRTGEADVEDAFGKLKQIFGSGINADELNDKLQKIVDSLQLVVQALERFSGSGIKIDGIIGKIEGVSVAAESAKTVADATVNSLSSGMDSAGQSAGRFSDSIKEVFATIDGSHRQTIVDTLSRIEGIDESGAEQVAEALSRIGVVSGKATAQVVRLADGTSRLASLSFTGKNKIGDSISEVFNFDKKTGELKNEVQKSTIVWNEQAVAAERASSAMNDAAVKAEDTAAKAAAAAEKTAAQRKAYDDATSAIRRYNDVLSDLDKHKSENPISRVPDDDGIPRYSANAEEYKYLADALNEAEKEFIEMTSAANMSAMSGEQQVKINRMLEDTTRARELAVGSAAAKEKESAAAQIQSAEQIKTALLKIEDARVRINAAINVANDNGVTGQDVDTLRAQLTALDNLKAATQSGNQTNKAFAQSLGDINIAAQTATRAIREQVKATKDGTGGTILNGTKEFLSAQNRLNSAMGYATSLLRDYSAAEKSSNESSRGAYRSIGESVERYKALNEQFRSGVVDRQHYNKEMSDLNRTVALNTQTIKENGDAHQAMGEKVKKTLANFAQWFSISRIVMGAYRSLKQMVSVVIEVDTAMTELRKVTNETEATYSRFLTDASGRAQSLGATIADTVNATADFARLGYSLAEATDLSNAAMVYKNVGDGIQDISEASESIISTMKAFGVETGDAMLIVDKFNETGNNFAISSQGVGEALQRSASAMAAANNTLDETIALATAANTVVQSPVQVGTALKTISMYLRAAKKDAEAAGEETDGMAESVGKLRDQVLALTKGKVDIQLDANTFKSTYQILKEISAVWNDIADVDQAALLELMGGKRNANVISAMLTNFETAEKVVGKIADENVVGSALAENEKFLNSIQGHINRLKTAYQELSTVLVDGDFVKTIVDSGTFLLSFATGVARVTDALGGLENVLLVIGGIVIESKFSLLVSIWETLKGKIDSLTGSVTNFVHSFVTMRMSGVSAADALSASFKNAGISISKLQVGIGVATAAIAVLGALQAAHERAARNASDNAKKYADSVEEYRNLISSYGQYKEYNAMTERTAEQEEAMRGALDKVITSLGGKAAALSSLESNEASYNKELDATIAKEKELASIDANKGVRSAEDALRKGVTNFFGAGTNLINDVNKEEYAILSKIPGMFDYFPEHSGGAFGPRSTSASGQLEYYYALMDASDKLMDVNGNAFSRISTVLAEMKPLVDAYVDSLYNYVLTTSSAEEGTEGFKNALVKEFEKSIALSSDKLESVVNGLLSDRGLQYDFSKPVSDITKRTTEEIYGDLVALREKRKIALAQMNEDTERALKISEKATYNSNVASLYEQADKAISHYNLILKQVSQNALYASDKVYGNVDLNSRKAIELAEGSASEYSDILKSWGVEAEKAGDLMSGVFAETLPFYNTDISITPVLDTGDGSVLLGKDTVRKYIFAIINSLKDSGKELSKENILALDATGFVVDGEKIQNIIADIGDTASETTKKINKVSTWSALEEGANKELKSAYNAVAKIARQLGISTDYLFERYKDNSSYSISELADNYNKIQEEISARNIDLSETVYGNIDTNNRNTIRWTEQNLEKYKDALRSWSLDADDLGVGDNGVIGRSEIFSGKQIAFTPVLSTENGAVLLNRTDVFKYFSGVFDFLRERGMAFSAENILAVDAHGIEVDGVKIKNIIADVGDSAEETAGKLEQVGKNGALQEALTAATVPLQTLANKFGVSVEFIVAHADELEKSAEGFDTIISRYGYATDSLEHKSKKADESLSATTEEVKDLTYAIRLGEYELRRMGLEASKSSDGFSTFASSIDEVRKVVEAQTTGRSISLADFDSDSLAEYRSALEYVNGAMQLNIDEVNKLIDAKAAEELQTSEANKAIDQASYMNNARMIQDYRNRLEELDVTKIEERRSIEASIDALLKENDALSVNIDRYNLISASIREATSDYQHWLNAQGASDYGDMADDTVSAIQTITDTYREGSDIFGNFGSRKFEAALDFIVPDSVDTEDLAAIEKYMKDFEGYLKIGKDGKIEGLDIDKFLKDSVDAGLMSYSDDRGFEILGEKKMEDFANGLNLSSGVVQAFFDELQLKGARFSWADEASKTIGDYAVSATQAAESLRKLGKYSDLDIKIDVSDIEDTDEQVAALDETISEMNGIIAEPDVDTSEIESAQKVIDYCIRQKQILTAPDVMRVSTDNLDSRMANAISLLQEYFSRESEIDVGINLDSADADLEALRAKIAALDPDVKARLGINTTSSEELQRSINELTADKLVVNAGIDPSAIDGYDPESKEVEVLYNPVYDLIPDKYDPMFDPIDVSVIYKPDYSRLPKTISVKAVAEYTAKGAITGASGSGYTRLNGSANAFGSARLSGDWRADGGRTLVGELGREIIVDPRTGKWYTVGENGAEFVNVPEGAIVFNNLQTEDLLKNGYVSGRASALVNGSALVSGSPFKPYTSASTATKTSGSKTSASGSSGSKSTSTKKSSNSSSSSSEKDVESWFEKQYKEHQHLLEMDSENVADYLNWLVDAYQKAYKEGIIELDDYRKYQEETYKGFHDLFKDYLNDVEHEIEMREEFEGESRKIVTLYKDLIVSVEKEIKDARAQGLDDTDDYIQELQKSWAGYKKSIKDIEDDINENVKSATEDLIDIRVDMLKQDIENEKDAIDKRLSYLKEFYDKQKELLQDSYDTEKYIEEQKEKRKSVSDIQAEIAQIELDNSAWAQKRRIELAQELVEAQKDLDDFEKDHALQTAQEELDRILEIQEKELNSQNEILEEKEKDTKALYDQALADIKNGSIQLYEEMVEWNNVYGDGISDTIKSAWEEAYKALKDYKDLYDTMYNGINLQNATGYTAPTESWDTVSVSNAGSKLAAASSSTSSATNAASSAASVTVSLSDADKRKVAAAIWNGGYGWGSGTTRAKRLEEVFGKNDIQALINKGIGKSDIAPSKDYTYLNMRKKYKGYASGTRNALAGLHPIDELGTETIFESADGTRYKMFSGGEKVLNARASEFLYEFANNGGEFLKKIVNSALSGELFDKIGKAVFNSEINMGDIIVQGSADSRTVSEIRRAQRDNLNTMLKEFGKLNR